MGHVGHFKPTHMFHPSSGTPLDAYRGRAKFNHVAPGGVFLLLQNGVSQVRAVALGEGGQKPLRADEAGGQLAVMRLDSKRCMKHPELEVS